MTITQRYTRPAPDGGDPIVDGPVPFDSAHEVSTTASGFADVVGSSPALAEAIEKASRLASSRVPILLLGETGVGKEVFARGIHASSGQRNGPFIALNCGSLNRELLASELFGHVDGAFTGARRGGSPGKIEAADGGTLLLDELGEMPLELQPHFLRVLEDGQVCRMGENKPRKVRFRLIAATNRNLRQEVDEARFRADLFYRISVTSIAIPALRERRDDIAALARSFLSQLCDRHGVAQKVLDPLVLARFENYRWPGNIRELRNVIESLVLTTNGRLVGLDDLPPEISRAAHSSRREGAHGGDATTAADPQLRGLQRGEFEQICSVLQRASGNATIAARELGIAKSTLYLKLKKYSLDESLHLWRSHGGHAAHAAV